MKTLNKRFLGLNYITLLGILALGILAQTETAFGQIWPNARPTTISGYGYNSHYYPQLSGLQQYRLRAFANQQHALQMQQMAFRRQQLYNQQLMSHVQLLGQLRQHYMQMYYPGMNGSANYHYQRR